MKIVHVASELFPYIKTGGLADAVASLAGVTFAPSRVELVSPTPQPPAVTEDVPHTCVRLAR
ncbi:MAG: glycogen/starch synthase, partial [Opitutales bacterium]